MNRLWLFAVLASLGVGYISGSHAAGIPPSRPMVFSGLLENEGTPITADTTVRVRFFSSLEGGAHLCETSGVVTPSPTGRFSIPLDDSCTDAVGLNPLIFTELQIGAETLAPRQPLGAVPYAVEAKRASEASGSLGIAISNLQEAVRPEQVFTATFDSGGAVVRQHPSWIQSSTLNSSGDGNVVFSVSLDTPVCIATGIGGGATAGATSVGSGNAIIQTRANTTPAAVAFSLLCHGAILP